MAAIQVNMRVPEVLLARINAAAGDQRTAWILEACRMRLDGTCEHGITASLDGACRTCHAFLFESSGVAQLGQSAHAISEQSGHVEVAGSNPAATTKPTIQELLDHLEKIDSIIVVSDDPIHDKRIEVLPRPEEPAIRVCGFKAYNDVDGETYTCGLAPHSPRLKHGAWRTA